MAFSLPTSGSNPKVAAKGSLEKSINDALALAGITILEPTWLALSAREGARDGQAALVSDRDKEYHSDPVVGGTVSNYGSYAWVASVGAWQRIGAVGEVAAASAADDAVQTAADVVASYALVQEAQAARDLADAYAGIKYRAATWAALSAISGLAGETGYISPEDIGAHTDPVATGSVANEGIYRWAANGLGSAQAERIGSTNSTPAGTKFGVFETLDFTVGAVFLDENDNQVAILKKSDEVELGSINAAELAAAAGAAGSLTERLSRGLTPYGDILSPSWAEWKLRNARYKLRLLQQGYSAQLVLNFFGDSWIEGPFIMPYFAKALQDKYGIAGLGWVGFQHFEETVPTAFVDPSDQPNTLAGNARHDLLPTPVINGTWGNNNGAAGAVANPSIGGITCATGTGYVRFNWTGAAHTSMDLHYFGDGSGVIRHSWDGGATWQPNTALSTVGVSHVALSNPTTATSGQLRIERVSGTIGLAGVYMKSTASGVRVNALGASGSNSSHWAAVNTGEWAGRVALLGADFTAGLHGTNDQSGQFHPVNTSAANVTELMGALKAAAPTMDLLWITPFENIRNGGSAFPMTEYAAAHREASVAGGWAYLDLQYAVGETTDLYANTTLTPFLEGLSNGNAGHPSRPEGGMMVSDAILRLFAPSL